MRKRPIVAAALAALSLSLAACGTTSYVPMPSQGLAPLVGALSHNNNNKPYVPSGGVPSQSQFATVQGVVTQLLPDDTSGLQHQNWVIKTSNGMTLIVNNDVTVGQRVSPMAVGEAMTVRGVEYHDPGKDGIHWTHHANVPNDAGYVQLATGQKFQ